MIEAASLCQTERALLVLAPDYSFPPTFITIRAKKRRLFFGRDRLGRYGWVFNAGAAIIHLSLEPQSGRIAPSPRLTRAWLNVGGRSFVFLPGAARAKGEDVGQTVGGDPSEAAWKRSCLNSRVFINSPARARSVMSGGSNKGEASLSIEALKAPPRLIFSVKMWSWIVFINFASNLNGCMGTKWFNLSYFSLDSLHDGLNVDITSWWRWTVTSCCFCYYYYCHNCLLFLSDTLTLSVSFLWISMMYLRFSCRATCQLCTALWFSSFPESPAQIQRVHCRISAACLHSSPTTFFGGFFWQNKLTKRSLMSPNNGRSLTLSGILTEFLRSHERVERGGILLNYPPFDLKLLGNFYEHRALSPFVLYLNCLLCR